MSWAKAPGMAVPPLPHPLVETFGRPTWREWRQRAEAVELAAEGAVPRTVGRLSVGAAELAAEAPVPRLDRRAAQEVPSADALGGGV